MELLQSLFEFLQLLNGKIKFEVDDKLFWKGKLWTKAQSWSCERRAKSFEELLLQFKRELMLRVNSELRSKMQRQKALADRIDRLDRLYVLFERNGGYINQEGEDQIDLAREEAES